jgi:hypothetical protein
MAEVQTSVRRLVTRCGRENAVTSRWQLSQALNRLDWSPPGLPRTAILCVRRLANPSPGSLRTGSTPRQSIDLWRGEFSRSLEQNARRAARPARELVGADANAVLFADHAELLACLALDWCNGRTFACWWWKALFPGINVPGAFHQAWTENPQHVPAAMCRLHQVAQGTKFLRALPLKTAAQVLENVLTAFGLLDLRAALRTTTDSRPVSGKPSLGTATAKSSAPWMPWVNVDPNLSRERRDLLIVCVMLELAPGEIRRPGFARALRDYDPMAGQVSKSNPTDSERVAPGRDFKPQSSEPSEAGETFVDQTSARTNMRAGLISRSAFLLTDAGGPGLADPNLLFDTVTPIAISSPTAKSSSCDSLTLLIEPPNEIVLTDWGGIFYLVNVALALGLYADFTMRLETGLVLPLWDFLSLVGRRLIGAELESDPLWAVLARLSGRVGGRAPGQGFDPPEEWRIPADWLTLLTDHPTAFAPKSVPELTVPPLERWLHWLVPFIAARLVCALHVDEGDTLPDLLFRHRARCEITVARLDVRFELAKHPIQLRLAGLDRDPGWIPAAGRTLMFHYD